MLARVSGSIQRKREKESQISLEDKDQLKSFDKRIIDCAYTIQEHLLEIAVCSLIMLIELPTKLDKCRYFG